MIRDEDQFVMKVRRLGAWREREGLRSKLWYHKLRQAFGLRPVQPFVAGFKADWWRVLQEGGEPGLRAYYRDVFRVQSADVPALIESGDLVLDEAFARFQEDRGESR